jgi:hypothetical protein
MAPRALAAHRTLRELVCDGMDGHARRVRSGEPAKSSLWGSARETHAPSGCAEQWARCPACRPPSHRCGGPRRPLSPEWRGDWVSGHEAPMWASQSARRRYSGTTIAAALVTSLVTHNEQALARRSLRRVELTAAGWATLVCALHCVGADIGSSQHARDCPCVRRRAPAST